MKARLPVAENFLELQLINPHYNFKANHILLESSKIKKHNLGVYLNISLKLTQSRR